MDTTVRPYDVITMGRSSIDLYSNGIGAPFVEISSFAAYVGGCPTNISVGTRRLGLRLALLTAVGDDQVGNFILHFLHYQARNEQAMVHTAVAYAKTKNRLQTLACTSSIGPPGATNMVIGAALATINRLPVLLLPGDIFARRNVAPVLQQLESEHTQDTSVNETVSDP